MHMSLNQSGSGDMSGDNQSWSLKGDVRSSSLKIIFWISASDFCFRVEKWVLRRSVRYGNGDFLYLLVLQFIFLNEGFTLLVFM